MVYPFWYEYYTQEDLIYYKAYIVVVEHWNNIYDQTMGSCYTRIIHLFFNLGVYS